MSSYRSVRLEKLKKTVENLNKLDRNWEQRVLGFQGVSNNSKNSLIKNTKLRLLKKFLNSRPLPKNWENKVRTNFSNVNKNVRNRLVNEIKKEYSRLRDIGEPFFITDIYSALKKANGVLDVSKVNVVTKIGGSYSDIKFNIQNNLSPDGRYINLPDNVIFEIKYPDIDIKGAIR